MADEEPPLEDRMLDDKSGIITPSEIPKRFIRDPWIRERIDDVANTLAMLLKNEMIAVQNLRGEVIDFGCALGQSAYVLKQYGGYVVALDINPGFIKMAIDEGLLTPDSAYVCDGFEYLGRSVPPNSINLLAAFRIMDDFPIARFYQSGQKVLKSGGQLLVSGHSDARPTIETHKELGEVRDCSGEFCLVYTKP